MKEKEEVSKIMEEARLALLNRQECVQREDGFHKEE